jgi:putative hemolysin
MTQILLLIHSVMCCIAGALGQGRERGMCVAPAGSPCSEEQYCT